MRAEQEGVLSIKPGTLNDTTWLRPVAHIWSNSAQPWVQFEEACLLFPGNPSGFDDIVEAWRRQRQRAADEHLNKPLEPTR